MAGFENPNYLQPFFPAGTASLYGAPNTATLPMSRQDLFFTGSVPGPGGGPAGWILPGGGQSRRSSVLGLSGLGRLAGSVPGGAALGPFGLPR